MRLIKIMILAAGLVLPLKTQDQQFFLSVNPKEAACIYEALWFEARGESKEGICAVLSVIQNRVLSDKFPNSYCGVVRQGKQFSYVLQRKSIGLSTVPKPSALHNDLANYMKSLANDCLSGKFKNTLDSDVYWYHTKRVKPEWSKKMHKVKTIGNHMFFKE